MKEASSATRSLAGVFSVLPVFCKNMTEFFCGRTTLLFPDFCRADMDAFLESCCSFATETYHEMMDARTVFLTEPFPSPDHTTVSNRYDQGFLVACMISPHRIDTTVPDDFLEIALTCLLEYLGGNNSEQRLSPHRALAIGYAAARSVNAAAEYDMAAKFSKDLSRIIYRWKEILGESYPYKITGPDPRD